MVDGMIIIIIIILEIILNVAYIFNEQPKVLNSINQLQKKRNLYCSNDKHFIAQIIFTFTTFIVSFIQCFRIRKLADLYNESKEILYATLMADLILALTLPLYYSRSTKNGRTFVMFLMITIMAGTFYFLLFFDKICLVFCPEKAKSSNLNKIKRSSDLQS